MFEIVERKDLNSEVVLMKIYAPKISKKAKAGQFIMLRVDEVGERIPLTIADYDRDLGTVTIIFQTVGYTTNKLAHKKKGDNILDFVGPLGRASCFDNAKKVLVVAGGLGAAIAYIKVKELNEAGCDVDVVMGFRNKDLIILEEEMRKVGKKVFITTDDGSNGNKGFVTDEIKNLLKDIKYDLVDVVGPLKMMKAVCDTTKPYGIKTTVSMNPIMIDGTGMCGCCRLTVGGEIKFACVDGPDFDGHKVHFDEIIVRNEMYRDYEKESVKKNNHECNLYKLAKDKEGRDE
ncbi:MAG: sulfide/dihydroorotate dehydrogenase-like FAD/NAD-binding protein [Clostridiales bacterium]|nr:sulfide/dihydroorotate dehydrogenase-like FAD/NAD-binding protein [Clostridiales bacterium]